MTEVIKEIKGFEGRYTISDCGIVRVKRTGYVKKPTVTKFGYHRVNLSATKSYRYKSFFIHRLVAMNFIPNPDNLPEVNHKDGDRLNNKVENLEWCTREQNIQHAFKYGKASNKGSKNPNSKLSETDVEIIRALKSTGRFYNTQIAKLFKVSSVCIDSIIRGNSWSKNETNKDNQQPSPVE